MTRPNEFRDAIAHCKSERERLLAEISTSWTAADVLIEGDRVSFRLSNGIVTASENLAENLVNWALAARETTAEAA